MSYSDIKPSPRPKSEAEWREARRERYRNASNGGFRFVPTKVLDSDAFNELSKSAKLVLIISLSQIDYWRKKSHKHLPVRESSIGPPRRDGQFSLPSNLLMERGIRSSQTITEARKEIVAAGFWETVETGSLYNTGVFRWSDNWLAYNQKPLAERKSLDPNAKAPGYCHYPNIIKHNDSLRAEKASELDTSSHQDQEYYIAGGNDHAQLELFEELAA